MTIGLGGLGGLGDWARQTAPVFGPQAKENVYRWATVTDDSPLEIRLDGDTLSLPLVPESLVDPARLTIGSRVWVQLFSRRVIVLGASAGGVLPAARPFAMSAGTVSIGVTSSDTGTQAVTFPAGRFTQAPIVSISQAANSKFWIPSLGGLTTSGFNAIISHRDGTTSTVTIGCHWTAVQMTSGAASG